MTCYHRGMKRGRRMNQLCLAASLVFLTLPVRPAIAQTADLLTEARLLYNRGQFDSALAAAERARAAPALADRADLIAARAYLERFRASATSDDLDHARERLRRIDPRHLDLRERTEFIVGLGEALYFDASYGAAADIFESVLDSDSDLPPDARQHVLDWWATAVDRGVWPQTGSARDAAYDTIRRRMRDELVSRPGSATAVYWMAAAARAEGDVQGAWDAVESGWVRASLATGETMALRSDLDRLMILGIVPERAKALAESPDDLRSEWERFKARWNP
jgi:tetratricopeptide (TPR) repeat protein